MNEIMEILQQVRLNQWSAMVQEREDSGLSVKVQLFNDYYFSTNTKNSITFRKQNARSHPWNEIGLVFT